MQISAKQVQRVLEVYSQNQVQRSEKVGKTAPLLGADKVVLSRESQEYQVARRAVDAAPEMREEKTADLSEAVKSGTYQVDGERIAEKILQRSLVDRLV